MNKVAVSPRGSNPPLLPPKPVGWVGNVALGLFSCGWLLVPAELGATPFCARIEHAPGGAWNIRANAEPGFSYRLQTTRRLGEAWNWADDEVVAESPEVTFSVPFDKGEDRRFWRVVWLAKQIAFLGDSITDGISGTDFTQLNGYGGVAQMALSHRFGLVRRADAYGTDSEFWFKLWSRQAGHGGCGQYRPASGLGGNRGSGIVLAHACNA
jgi:hypothetical protein